MLPERIKRYRKKNGLTQEGLAVALGCSPATISCYESGWRTPSIKRLLAISALLECSIDDLTAEEAPLPAPAALKGGENMSEQPARPYPITIVGRLSYEYHDGEDWGEGEHKIPADFLPEVMHLVAELKKKYPQLT